MDKKQQIIIASIVGVVVVALGLYLMFGRGGGSSETASGTPASPTASAGDPGEAGMPGGAPRVGAPGFPTEPGQMGGPTMAMGGRPGMGAPGARPDPFGAKPGAPGAPAASGKLMTASAAGVKPSADPFDPSWKKPSQPPVFAIVQPMRLASYNVVTPPAPNTEIREVPVRRVSGILSGDGIYAILEGDGEPEIVKPGSQTSDGYRVVAITANSVKLQRKEGNVTLTQIVPLSDVATSGPQTATFGNQRNFGGAPGFPGANNGGGRNRRFEEE